MRATRFLGMSALALCFAIGACTAEVEEEGKAPDVDVQGGEMPKVDVDAAEVNVGTDTSTVVTPDVDVEAPKNP